MEEGENSKTFGESLAVLRRYKGQILAVTAVLAAVGSVVALGLPPVYRSTATVLVQEQEVPSDLVRSTITSFADERIQVISEKVMTRVVLLRLVDKYGLYDRYRAGATDDEIVDRMRKDIKLTTVNADVSDRSNGSRQNATIAFTISYDSPQADRAQSVATELASLYLEENVKARQESVAETTAFLAQEANRLAAQMQDTEAKLAEFKRRNAGRLPDSSMANMQLAERAGSEVQRIELEITTLQERQLALEAQLPAVPPNLAPMTNNAADRSQTPADRLRALQAQYASASAVYGPDHPDMRRMQREIAALSAETGAPGEENATAEKLKKLEADLVLLRERYSEDYPDIQRTKRSIAALKAPAVGQGPTGAVDKGAVSNSKRPDNPAYLALTAQIEGVKRELNHLSALRDDLHAQQRTYDSRLLQIPEIEREYQDLTRDYDNAQTRYREVKAKEMQAEVSQVLEQDRKAERFSLGEPAHLPQRPVSPNRPVVALVGFITALGGGLGLAWLRDALDPSVKGPLELARIATIPILTAIPYINTHWERTGKRRRAWLVACLIALLVVALLLGTHFFLTPWSALLDRLAHVVR